LARSVCHCGGLVPLSRGAGAAVPISPFLDGAAFDPETIETMSAALSEACQALRLIEKEDAAVRLLAMRIIDRAGRYR
jgi:hypothetical protein